MFLEAVKPETYGEALEGLNQFINALHAMIELLEQRAQDDPMLAGTRVMLEDLRERGHGLYLGFAGLKNSVL